MLPIESSVSGPVTETHDLLVGLAASRSTRRRSSRSGTSSSVSPRSRSSEIRVVRSHPVAARPVPPPARVAPRARDRAGTTRRRAQSRARATRPRSRSRASGAALHGLSCSRDVGDHPEPTPASSPSRTDQLARLDGGSPSRSRPTTSRAPSTARSSRSPATRSTSSSSRRARSRRPRGATASTPSSPAIPLDPDVAEALAESDAVAALHRLRLLPGLIGRKDYSGTPLSQKLGAKPGAGVVVFFTTSRAELEPRFAALKETLDPADGLWIAWPKKAARIETDLSFDAVQETGLAAGLVDNKSCSIDERWQALRFVYRLRTAEHRARPQPRSHRSVDRPVTRRRPGGLDLPRRAPAHTLVQVAVFVPATASPCCRSDPQLRRRSHRRPLGIAFFLRSARGERQPATSSWHDLLQRLRRARADDRAPDRSSAARPPLALAAAGRSASWGTSSPP